MPATAIRTGLIFSFCACDIKEVNPLKKMKRKMQRKNEPGFFIVVKY
jgi:hypothetical protein